jgi:hypothetical protein
MTGSPVVVIITIGCVFSGPCVYIGEFVTTDTGDGLLTTSEIATSPSSEDSILRQRHIQTIHNEIIKTPKQEARSTGTQTQLVRDSQEVWHFPSDEL